MVFDKITSQIFKINMKSVKVCKDVKKEVGYDFKRLSCFKANVWFYSPNQFWIQKSPQIGTEQILTL